jgi:hypothetical protein
MLLKMKEEYIENTIENKYFYENHSSKLISLRKIAKTAKRQI